MLIAALSLSGCFGLFKADVSKVSVSAENDIKKIVAGEVEITADGKHLFFVKYSSHNDSYIVKREIKIRIDDSDPYISHEAVDFEGTGSFGNDEEGMNVAQLAFIEFQDGTMPISKKLADELVTVELPPHEE